MQRNDEIENFHTVQSSPFYFENNLPKRLKPHEVYAAIVGIFAESSNEYQLLDIIFPEYKQERARVYLEKKSSQLHIFYYPGKDNDALDTSELPLKNIMEEVNAMLGEKYHQDILAQAKKLFVVCESNTYYGYKIGHFIFASCANKKLTTEDSVKYIFGLGWEWHYDESYIDSLFEHDEKEKIQRGYQIIWNDNASCGNHVIAAAKREIKNELAQALQIIDANVLIQHGEFYEKGRQEINTARECFPKKADKGMLNISPVPVKLLKMHDPKDFLQLTYLTFFKTQPAEKDKSNRSKGGKKTHVHLCEERSDEETHVRLCEA